MVLTQEGLHSHSFYFYIYMQVNLSKQLFSLKVNITQTLTNLLGHLLLFTKS